MVDNRNLKIGIGLGLVIALSALAHAQTGYVDTFEASTINSFWTTTQQYGTVILSTALNHTPGGRQSLKFASSDGDNARLRSPTNLPRR